jgi:hypothetical protein
VRKIHTGLLLSALLFSVPAWAQEIFVQGNSQAATQARNDLAKSTRFRASFDASHTILVVNRESWSEDFLSPVSVAISMKLISPKGELLWSKTEPVGSRSEAEVVQNLLQELANANLRPQENNKTPAASGPARPKK